MTISKNNFSYNYVNFKEFITFKVIGCLKSMSENIKFPVRIAFSFANHAVDRRLSKFLPLILVNCGALLKFALPV